MGKLKHNFKKGMAFVLSLAMVTGLALAMSGGANTVQAAAGTGTEPSVTAYATKDQLMDGTFKPKDDGTADNYGKLVFGKNSSGSAQEWYILGKDDGVSGDNTIIFAASPIATGQRFEDDWQNNKTTTSLWSDCVYNGTSISEVSPNHYGASDLRVALQRMLEDESGNTVETYFTTAEQGLMNYTTVTTQDPYNNVTYTTTDKLYALQGDFDNNKYLWAGTGDSTVLARDSYWSSGADFWLRSPRKTNFALLALTGNAVGSTLVDNGGPAVQPASNLNLSSVFFASAATAASSDTVSGTITDGTAMTLRLNGTGKGIGTVTYNNTTGDIKATKGSTSQTVALVVQGNDGTNDWYYSKKIDTSEISNNLNSNIDKENVRTSSNSKAIDEFVEHICQSYKDTIISTSYENTINEKYSKITQKITKVQNILIIAIIISIIGVIALNVKDILKLLFWTESAVLSSAVMQLAITTVIKSKVNIDGIKIFNDAFSNIVVTIIKDILSKINIIAGKFIIVYFILVVIYAIIILAQKKEGNQNN